LAFAISLAQFAAFAVEDDPGKLMASFTAVELNEDAPPVVFVVDEAQQVKRLDEATQLLQGAGEPLLSSLLLTLRRPLL